MDCAAKQLSGAAVLTRGSRGWGGVTGSVPAACGTNEGLTTLDIVGRTELALLKTELALLNRLDRALWVADRS